MYHINPRNSFKRDYKKIKHNIKFDIIEFDKVIYLMEEANFKTLKEMPYRSHSLEGQYIDCLELHIKNDMLLIYIIDEKNKTIELVRIGTHSQLFK